jgi:hypothetical protein
MQKTPSPSLEQNFGIWVNQKGLDGKLVYGPDGKVLKMKVRMEDATFADGQRQSLYFEPGHPQAGLFKGMSVLLQERGMSREANLRAECKNFQCPKDQTSCCVRWTLYDQPDFVRVESLLETACKARGFEVIFLPKFHCELNFIEQCWGFAKRIYWHYPASSKEADLERNVLSSLDSVPLTSMRRYEIINHPTYIPLTKLATWHRFATRSCRFIDAYDKGLNGKEAAWASKQYRGHRVLPESLLRDLDNARL